MLPFHETVNSSKKNVLPEPSSGIYYRYLTQATQAKGMYRYGTEYLAVKKTVKDMPLHCLR